jgi:molybdenum cofactor sulfurtransferase
MIYIRIPSDYIQWLFIDILVKETQLNTDLLKDQFPQLPPGHVYADWTGAALPPIVLIDGWHQHLRGTLIGNPHSHHRPSAEALQRILETRAAILKYFNAPTDEYEVIFTPGASGAIRLLEHYVFAGGELLLTADNHNTVNGLRETAKHNYAVHRYAPIKDDLTFDAEMLDTMLSYPRSTGNRLFAFPAKSNYAGTLHDLAWVQRAKDKGWDVLLDAAAYSSNCRLDLSVVKPDFVPLSFYKMFGYPTGLGCLIIRKEAYRHMHKKWFAGGSILIVSVMLDFFAPEALGYARFEDGSVNFGQIPAIIPGLQFMESLGDVNAHATGLASALYDRLAALRVGRGSVLIHSARGNDTVTFSVKRDDKIVDAWLFEKAATARNVFVRSGCFCNPGPNEKIFGYELEAFARLFNDAIRMDAISIEKLGEYSGGAPIGAIRASFGYANTMADIERFAEVTGEILSTF